MFTGSKNLLLNYEQSQNADNEHNSGRYSFQFRFIIRQELVYYACNHTDYAETNQDNTDIKQGNHITPFFSFRTYQQSVQ